MKKNGTIFGQDLFRKLRQYFTQKVSCNLSVPAPVRQRQDLRGNVDTFAGVEGGRREIVFFFTLETHFNRRNPIAWANYRCVCGGGGLGGSKLASKVFKDLKRKCSSWFSVLFRFGETENRRLVGGNRGEGFSKGSLIFHIICWLILF